MKFTDRIEKIIAMIDAKAPIPAIKNQLVSLHEFAEAHEAECKTHATLDAVEIEEQRKRSEVTPEERKVLVVMDAGDGPWEAKKIAEILEDDPSVIRYRLITLKEKECVREVPTGFYLKDKGRKAIHEA